MKKYFSDIWYGITSILTGMRLTFRHLKDAPSLHAATNVQHPDYFINPSGIVTLQYPYESIPVPDHGRYQLHNEIDDCIVCDKCAVICPVDCIAIEAIKSAEPIGETSDGSVKRLYAANFDIDMAKCCFCGLCTSVCPTECLTMTNQYDFSVFDVKEMNFSFANLSPEESQQKRVLYEQFLAEKEALKLEKKADVVPAADPKIASPFKPLIKPVIKSETAAEDANTLPEQQKEVKKPVSIKPVIRPIPKKEEGEILLPPATNDTELPSVKKPSGLKPIIKPVIKKSDPPAPETP